MREGDEIALEYLSEHETGFRRGFPSARLERLVELGFVKALKNCYRITGKGRTALKEFKEGKTV